MDDIIAAYTEAFATPFNVFLLLLTISMLLFWWSAHWWQTPERVKKRARFYSPKATQYLQKFRGDGPLTKAVDFVSQQVWLFVFSITVALEVYICGLQGDQAWRYGLPVILSWGTSMTIQFVFPVIVPIRWNDFGRELPVVPIRLQQFKQSDVTNGLLYNGLPSNHFGMMLAGVILSLFIAQNDPWHGWIIAMFVFLVLALFFCVSVIYLGEHYIWDLLASIVVYVPIMLIVFNISNVLIPMT
jgi:membrane-associated phospholipid phosphatase